MTREIVEIGRVIRNALVFNFRNAQGCAVNADSLLDTVARLFALLAERKVDYLLVGGVALLQYVEGRNTEDIDLIMDVASLEKLPEIHVSARTQDFARGTFGELRLDILQSTHPLFAKVRRSYATVRPFREQEIPCATVEGLLLLKLYSLPSLYRQGDFTRVGLYENDVATLLYNYKTPLAPLLQELAAHMSETDLAELRKILDEIRQRITRFELGSQKG